MTSGEVNALRIMWYLPNGKDTPVPFNNNNDKALRVDDQLSEYRCNAARRAGCCLTQKVRRSHMHLKTLSHTTRVHSLSWWTVPRWWRSMPTRPVKAASR